MKSAILVGQRPVSFLSVSDLPPPAIRDLLDRAAEAKLAGDRQGLPLVGQVIALIFQKPSLRTRVSFEVGISRLGGTSIVLRGDEVGLGDRETAVDVGRTLERYVDGIVARVHRHEALEEMAAAVAIPVVNALSDREHPCQALADLLTLREHLGGLVGRQLVFLGDGNNVASSLILAGAAVGLHVRLVTPLGHGPRAEAVAAARTIASGTGARIEIAHDPISGVRDADAVYTDVWASMGQEAEAEERARTFAPFALTRRLLRHAPDPLVMHCLPAHRGAEIEAEVLDGPRSIVFDQAENRLWAQQALLVRLMAPSWEARMGQEPLRLPLFALERATA